MKNVTVFLFFLLAIPCTSQNGTFHLPDTAKPYLKELHWQLRDLLRMQLPATLPIKEDEIFFKKTYSLDYYFEEKSKSGVIEVPEKHLHPETEQILTGSKYFIPLEDIAVEKIQIVLSDDQSRTALRIPAVEGKTFTWHPYSNKPDKQVDELIIGWFDRIQDRTLQRALVLWTNFVKKLAE